MKKFVKFFILFVLLQTLCACDKMEDNGDFAGLWQLTEWKHLPDGAIVKDKNNRIFYSVQLDVMQVKGDTIGLNANSRLISRFRRTADTLYIGTVFYGIKDSIVDIDNLAPLGVPADGKFAIDRLNKHAMVLRTDEAVLTFRKY